MEGIKNPKIVLRSDHDTGFHIENGKVTLIKDGEKVDLKNEVQKVYLEATHINSEMDYDEFFDKISNIFYPEQMIDSII